MLLDGTSMMVPVVVNTVVPVPYTNYTVYIWLEDGSQATRIFAVKVQYPGTGGY